MTLPVASIAAELVDSLDQHGVVLLTAPPGAGKSTFLPLYLLQHPRWQQRRIIMLEPRRLAAKNIASYVAAQLGEDVGQQVGYQIRYESCVSAKTRLTIVTEGVLTRKIQQDPQLEGIDLIIFDEFHERSLHADLALALSLEVQQLNSALRLLLMSATLASDALAARLQAPVLSCEGRQFPVQLHYVAPNQQPLWQQAASIALTAVAQGSVLVFLPGMREIDLASQWLAQQLPALAATDGTVLPVQLHALIGSLSLAEQQAAIAPAPAGYAKIVLATNIAETSLTIDGIVAVVDSGVAREAQFLPRAGFTSLETVNISQAAAVQRMGRAGRLQAGVCYRIDTAERFRRRPAFDTPAIEKEDLLGLVFDIAQWGAQVDDLFWLNPPPKAALAAARDTLQRLGVVTPTFQLTALGQQVAALGLSPRQGVMLLKAKTLAAKHGDGCLALAAKIAVLLDERRSSRYVDLFSQLGNTDHGLLATQAMHLARFIGVSGRLPSSQQLPLQWAALLLSYAYPDRIAQRRGRGYLLVNGAGAELPADDSLQGQDFLVIAELRRYQQQNVISSAMALSASDLLQYWLPSCEQINIFTLDAERGRFIAQQRTQLGALVLKSQNAKEQLTNAQRQQAWQQWFMQQGLTALPWTVDAEQLCIRVQIARRLRADLNLPDFSRAGLLADCAQWLLPHVQDIQQLSALEKLPLQHLLWQRLDYSQQQLLQQWLPSHWRSVLGTEVALEYKVLSDPADDQPIAATTEFEHAFSAATADAAIVDSLTTVTHAVPFRAQAMLAIRIQEMFGQLQTPQIADGKVPVIISLLSPARRPLQVTADLASFWQNAYQDVKKEMKGRYPKHYWPDDPAVAEPTNKTKKAMQR
jgi:ATP-dependent helicase HrpB